MTLLREAVVEGRLTLEEFSDRVEAAQVARTRADLAGLTGDLPSPTPAASPVPAPSSSSLAPPASPASPISRVARHRAICSRIVRKGPWTLPARSSFQAFFGTINLDLRQASLAAGEVELEIYNLFSTVTVIVPTGIAVNVEGGGAFASQVIDAPAVAPAPGDPVLRIKTSGPGGTLYVRTREPAPQRLKQMLGVGGD